MLRRQGILPADASYERSREIITSFVLARSHKVLLPARAVAAFWGCVLLTAVFWGVWRTQGFVPAVAAALIVSLTPETIAHSSIAGSDMPFTALAFLSVLFLSRLAEKPTALRRATAAFVIGLAWATRHSALVLLLVAGLIELYLAWKKTKSSDLAAKVEHYLLAVFSCVSMSALAFVVLWAGDGFATLPLSKVALHTTKVQIPDHIGPIELGGLPIPTSIVSMLKQISHQAQGHEAYFLGEVGRRGWPLYFPVAFLLKTPLGLLAIYVAAAACVRPKSAFEGVCLATLAILWITLLKNHVNIGLRYALLTYPLAAPSAARLFGPAMLSDRVWRSISVLALGALVWSSAAAQPRCLSYFNPLGGGPSAAWLYLADSNVDWGQDFDRLSDEIRRLGIKDVTIDVSTERQLKEPWVFAIPFPSKEFQIPAATASNRRLYADDGSYLPVYTRYFAVSVSRLMGLYSQNDMSWLKTRRLVERIGDSVFLFDMDEPADATTSPFNLATKRANSIRR